MCDALKGLLAAAGDGTAGAGTAGEGQGQASSSAPVPTVRGDNQGTAAALKARELLEARGIVAPPAATAATEAAGASGASEGEGPSRYST